MVYLVLRSFSIINFVILFHAMFITFEVVTIGVLVSAMVSQYCESSNITNLLSGATS